MFIYPKSHKQTFATFSSHQLKGFFLVVVRECFFQMFAETGFSELLFLSTLPSLHTIQAT